jgi:hypothetical protein
VRKPVPTCWRPKGVYVLWLLTGLNTPLVCVRAGAGIEQPAEKNALGLRTGRGRPVRAMISSRLRKPAENREHSLPCGTVVSAQASGKDLKPAAPALPMASMMFSQNRVDLAKRMRGCRGSTTSKPASMSRLH